MFNYLLSSTRLSDSALSRVNQFDLIRLLAASLVIFSHCFPLIGLGDDREPFKLLNGFDTFGALSVHIFFTISGFLITKSWATKPFFFEFLKNRILRIYPGLLVCLLLTVFLLGPLITGLPTQEYFTNFKTFYYLRTFLLCNGIEFQLPGVFQNVPYPDVVNGSLWTLPIEVKCYLLTLLLGKFGLLSRRWFSIILVILLFGLQFLPHSPRYDGSLQCATYFVMGSLYFLYQDKIRLSPLVSILLLVAYVLSFHTLSYYAVSEIALPYILFTLAFAPVTWTKKLTAFGDFSYGLYIYAFPVQQLVMMFFGPKIGIAGFFLASFIPTYLLAALSWFLIEKPALALKRFFPHKAIQTS